MQPRTKFEEKILKEISSLPEDLQLKLSRILLFLKKEMIKDRFSEEKATEDFIIMLHRPLRLRRKDRRVK